MELICKLHDAITNKTTENIPDIYAMTTARTIAGFATDSLKEELKTFPKPGSVSFHDSGSHNDMTAETFIAGITALSPYFYKLAEAGINDEPVTVLREIGMEAEQAMLKTTNGVNTHRGAIFSIGFLCAAAGFLTNRHGLILPANSLGDTIVEKWSDGLTDPQEYVGDSHGSNVFRKYKVGGAREEAASGFPNIYNIGLPALREALAHQPLAFAGVHCFFALMSSVQDTTILHRGGQDALDYAMIEAKKFMDAGGTFNKEWEIKATNIHKEFVRRRLSSGGIADLLAATLFVNRLEEAVPRRN